MAYWPVLKSFTKICYEPLCLKWILLLPCSIPIVISEDTHNAPYSLTMFSISNSFFSLKPEADSAVTTKHYDSKLSIPQTSSPIILSLSTCTILLEHVCYQLFECWSTFIFSLLCQVDPSTRPHLVNNSARSELFFIILVEHSGWTCQVWFWWLCSEVWLVSSSTHISGIVTLW